MSLASGETGKLAGRAAAARAWRLPFAGGAGLSALVLALPAHAHAVRLVDGTPGLMDGLLHPFSGLDHILAMLSVGLWAALRGERALTLWPATFILAMLAGFAFGDWGAAGLSVEPAVMASVIVLGCAVAAGARAPRRLAIPLIALFGLLHGFAHGVDAAGAGAGFEFGMIASTALLLALGVGVGLTFIRLRQPLFIQLLGAGAALGGVLLAVAG